MDGLSCESTSSVMVMTPSRQRAEVEDAQMVLQSVEEGKLEDAAFFHHGIRRR